MARKRSLTTEDQSRLAESLLRAEAYPHPVSSVEMLETHISLVFLTGPFAYKIKKAVKLDFLDFSTLERRRRYCQEELRLNRQWAPALYLEVVPIRGTEERPAVAGNGPIIEYAVKMVQFPQDSQLDRQLDSGLLREKDMYELAETVAGYHEVARIIDYENDTESVRKVTAPILENFAPLQQAIDMELLARVREWSVARLSELKPVLVQRRKEGYVRECHGDLHLANLVRTPDRIVAFDCVEFSADLRNIDVLSDVAFLVMDLVAAARQDLAYAFLNRYLECTGDYAGMRVFGLYFVYHCMIRAKVAAIRSAERLNAGERRRDIEQLKHHLAVAVRWIDAPPPRVVAMHGFSASGKTWLSTRLMTQLAGIRVRSDIERKRLFGLNETASSHSGPGEGIYTEGAGRNVYGAVLDASESLIDAGFSVIVDASFLRRADRQALVALARRKGASYVFVETHADRVELERRLQSRRKQGGEASEADLAVLQHQFEVAEPLTQEEKKRCLPVSTDADVDIGQVIKALNALMR